MVCSIFRDYNVKQHFKHQSNKQKLDGVKLKILSHFEETTPFPNHSRLDAINRQAKKLKLPVVFEHVTQIYEDNGEEFLLEYFESQKIRNKKYGVHQKNSQCLCPSCIEFLTPGKSFEAVPAIKGLKTNIEVRQQQKEHQFQQLQQKVPQIIPKPSIPPVLFAPTYLLTFGHPCYASQCAVPADSCFNQWPWWCEKFWCYRNKNLKNRGRPPHNNNCPRRNTQQNFTVYG